MTSLATVDVKQALFSFVLPKQLSQLAPISFSVFPSASLPLFLLGPPPPMLLMIYFSPYLCGNPLPNITNITLHSRQEPQWSRYISGSPQRKAPDAPCLGSVTAISAPFHSLCSRVLPTSDFFTWFLVVLFAGGEASGYMVLSGHQHKELMIQRLEQSGIQENQSWFWGKC